MFRAYVLHVPTHTERWAAIRENFEVVSDFIHVVMWRAFALDHPRVVNTDFAGFDRPGRNGQVGFLKCQRIVVFRIDFNGGIVI